ncbi:hypothetical protein JTE90_015590 [Oedothorax gibbosus]|uniref:Uncharacterized protein n=1 Tax=Oedothorax gibbosus TaxID=931172 RepID=A0AAV6TYL4_9ARAC|nr:hypothetical protein JTE90_015590 [Oedothorax gibbosus]
MTKVSRKVTNAQLEQQSTLNKSAANNHKPQASLDKSNSSTSHYTQLESALPDFEFSQGPSDTNEVNYQPNPENQHDFNYSQKLFHIDDGNLYSIFSPIQGRSYGMKPSFLRKQKYTVQECHGRGRKNLRKGLKFHNFLPSESVTSEKDNGYLRNKWKVHSECRLREEHGTKQITISNWSQSVQNSATEPMTLEKNVTEPDLPVATGRSSSSRQNTPVKFANHTVTSGHSSCDLDPYDFSLSLQQSTSFDSSNIFAKNMKDPTSTITSNKACDTAGSAASKRDSLSFVLNSLLDKPELAYNQNLNNDVIDNSFKSSHLNQKRRRKPVQTRKVVPYVKYLSIMEENDSLPLDLSSKCGSETSVSPPSTSEELQICQEIGDLSYRHKSTKKKRSSPIEFNKKYSGLQNVPASCDSLPPNSLLLGNLLQNKIPMPLMFFSPPATNGHSIAPPCQEAGGSMPQGYGKLNMALNNKQAKIKNLQPPTKNAQYTVHKSFVKEPNSRIRKLNQRSVIKQKLEDTFKQNGFLVKTKQVSDGEATFCKFRQLRKYTRYYLKSWQQHLPDEVNKMWKGFLPPKTVLPPVSGTSDLNNDSP